MDLAQRMGLTDTQVKTWYQNRRFVFFSHTIFGTNWVYAQSIA